MPSSFLHSLLSSFLQLFLLAASTHPSLPIPVFFIKVLPSVDPPCSACGGSFHVSVRLAIVLGGTEGEAGRSGNGVVWGRNGKDDGDWGRGVASWFANQG